jgi:hypothetical protein
MDQFGDRDGLASMASRAAWAATLICIKGLAAALLAKSNCCCVWHYAIQSDGGAPSERPLFSYRQQIGWFAFSLEMQAIGRIQGLKPIGDAPRCREWRRA